MRIKLNLTQMTPVRSPTVYWLYVNMNEVLFIKQLKAKVQKVLKESRDIELRLDDVPFLDEDDILAIRENEEITVTVNERNGFTKPDRVIIESSVVPPNDILPTENIAINCVNLLDSSTSSVPQTSSKKKRVRKRTHKKNTHQLEPVTPDQNNYTVVETDTSTITLKEPSKIHKRFKLDNEENGRDDDDSSLSSEDETLHVEREVFRCDSSRSDYQKKQNTVKLWKEEKPLKTKGNRVNIVPVFTRVPKITSHNSDFKLPIITSYGPVEKYNLDPFHSNNDDNKINSSASEDYEMLVVDWKNMSPIKITNISELQLYNLIQFKTLSMNEYGEPEMSPVITGRLEHIDANSLTLVIQVLSGIKEFMKLNPKFRVNKEDDEDNYGQHEVQYQDLYDVYKLI